MGQRDVAASPVPGPSADECVVVETPRAELKSFSSQGIPRERQWNYCAEQVFDVVVPAVGKSLIGKGPDDGFDFSFTMGRIGGLSFFQTKCDAVVVSRVAENRMRDEYAGVGLSVTFAGRHVVLGRNSTLVRPGDVGAYDWAVPFEAEWSEPHHHAFLVLPRERLDGVADRASPHGRVFAPDQGLPQLFRYHMARLAALKAGEAPAYAGLPDDIQDVALAVLDGRRERVESLRPSLRRAQLAAVKDYVAKRAPLGDLPTERVAARFGMSPAHLERLFALEGTSVQDFARDCRLDACREALRDPRFLGMAPARIAAAFGFDDPAGFARIYHRRFGQAPRSFLTGN